MIEIADLATVVFYTIPAALLAYVFARTNKLDAKLGAAIGALVGYAIGFTFVALRSA